MQKRLEHRSKAGFNRGKNGAKAHGIGKTVVEMMDLGASMLSKKGKAGKGENIGRKEGLESEHDIRIKTQSRTIGDVRTESVVKKKK